MSRQRGVVWFLDSRLHSQNVQKRSVAFAFWECVLSESGFPIRGITTGESLLTAQEAWTIIINHDGKAEARDEMGRLVVERGNSSARL